MSVQYEYQQPPNVIVPEPLNDKMLLSSHLAPKPTRSSGSTTPFQTKFYGDCSFFPAYIPPNITMIVQTSSNVFMKTSNGLYATGLSDYKTKTIETVPFVVKGMPSGLTQVTSNSRRMVALIDGKVYKCSHISEPIKLKRIGELQGIKQISCSEKHYAALTTIGEVYLWGENEFGEIGAKRQKVQEDIPMRVNELTRRKIQKVICRNGYTACMTRDGDVITLGKIQWSTSEKVVDICGNNEKLYGLRRDGVVVSNDGTIIKGNFEVDRIIEGLESIVGESNGTLVVSRGNEWQKVEYIGTRDWSGRDNSLIVLDSSTKEGFPVIFNAFKTFVKQMELINSAYCESLLSRLRDLKVSSVTKDRKEIKKQRKATRAQSVFVVSQKEETFDHLVKMEEPLNYLYLIYSKTQKVYSFLMTIYGDNNKFNVADFYQKFFDELEVLFIDYSDCFQTYLEVLNICKMLSPSFLTDLDEIAKTKFTPEDQTLFNKHCDLLSIVITPFKFLSHFYLLTQQYRKINKEFPRSYFDRFETLLFRCNEMLKFEDILSISHVFSTNGEYVVYLSTMKELVTQLTRPNIREQNYSEIFLLMYRLYTTPEQVIDYLIPNISIDETYEQKTRLLGLLRNWMYKYPQDFVDLGKSEEKFINYLSTPKEQFKRVQNDKINILDLFDHIKQNEKDKKIKIELISFENVSIDHSEFMVDVNKVSNTMTYVYKKLFTKIQPVELLNYLDKNKKDQSLNIRNMVESFNGLSKMYLDMFKATPSDKKLALLKYTIQLLDIFLSRDKNFHAICGIVFTFIRIPEMDDLKKHLNSEEKSRFDYFDNLCCFESNYKNLRDTINQAEAPLLPFFGIISKDLATASEYNASKENNLYNFNKLRIMYGVVMDIIHYQPNDVHIPRDVDDYFHRKFLQIHNLTF